jgi:hypothetical protein
MTSGAAALTAAATAARTSSIDRDLDRSTPGPPPAPCRWLSINPGISVRPARSMSSAFGPASARMAAEVPVARMRSPATATA